MPFTRIVGSIIELYIFRRDNDIIKPWDIRFRDLFVFTFFSAYFINTNFCKNAGYIEKEERKQRKSVTEAFH